MKLFDDQHKFTEELAPALKRHHSIIACAATGYGKTVVFVNIVERAIQKGRTVLVLTESKKIFNQIDERIPGTILINPKATDGMLMEKHLYIAMAQTLANRETFIKCFQAFGAELLIVIDEAHIGTFNTLLEALPLAQKLGFTATPDARWAKHLPVFYKSIVIGPQPHELVQMGRLSPYKHFARVSANLDLLKLHKGEFTEESQEQVFGTAKVFDGLKEDLLRLPYKKCLIFTASIKDCMSVYAQLKEGGFECTAVHSQMSEKDFKFNLNEFTHGEINICISVGTLTKGFDCPAIDLIVLRRKTTSLPLFLQMIGRGSRWMKGKDFFTVLDYGQNYLSHGLWDMERDWKSLWNRPKKARDGIAAIKICPICERIVAVSSSCCSECGYEFVKKDIPLEVGKLIEVTELYSKMIGKRVSTLTPEELAIYAKLKGKKNFAARIAHARERDGPEGNKFLSEYGKAMGYKSSWADFLRNSKSEHEKISYPDFELK